MFFFCSIRQLANLRNLHSSRIIFFSRPFKVPRRARTSKTVGQREHDIHEICKTIIRVIPKCRTYNITENSPREIAIVRGRHVRAVCNVSPASGFFPSLSPCRSVPRCAAIQRCEEVARSRLINETG